MINDHDFPPLPSQENKQKLAIKHGATGRAPATNSQKAFASFNDLPDELIVEILEYLPGIDNDKCPHAGKWTYMCNPLSTYACNALSTLTALALTSHRFYRLVIGHLYVRYDNRSCDSYLLLRTVVSDPRLARLVRDVSFQFKQRTRPVKGQWGPSAQDKRVIKQGLRAISVPNWKTRATECNLGSDSDELLYYTILLCTPNIRSIIHEDGIRAPSPVSEFVNTISKAAAGAFGGVHRFEHLRSLKIDVLASDLLKFVPLFRLQSLRKLQLLGASEYDRSDDDEEGISSTLTNARELQRLIPPASNNLENLMLERCIYSELCIDVLVSSSRRLKAFAYNADLEDHWGWDTAPKDRSKTIIEILRRHETSLETINLMADMCVDREEPGRVSLYDNMAGFTSLKELGCPLAMIASEEDDMFAERLPSSLLRFRTYIRVQTNDVHRVESLKHMLANCQTYTPRLREVLVVQPLISDKDWRECARLASEAGVRFRFQLRDGFMDRIYIPEYKSESEMEVDSDSDTESGSD